MVELGNAVPATLDEGEAGAGESSAPSNSLRNLEELLFERKTKLESPPPPLGL
jgi:hypothetical protein